MSKIIFQSPPGHETTIHDIAAAIQHLNLPIQRVEETRTNYEWIFTIPRKLSREEVQGITSITHTLGGKQVDIKIKKI